MKTNNPNVDDIPGSLLPPEIDHQSDVESINSDRSLINKVDRSKYVEYSTILGRFAIRKRKWSNCINFRTGIKRISRKISILIRNSYLGCPLM